MNPADEFAYEFGEDPSENWNEIAPSIIEVQEWLQTLFQPSLTDTGENVQKLTRVFSTRRLVIPALGRVGKKRRK